MAMTATLWWTIASGLVICARALSSKYANITGDVMLGGLFPIHTAVGDGKCGNIQEQDGIQMLEAMAFSIKKINKGNFLPGFTLGMIGMDTCESDSIALENSLEFVKSKVNSISGPEQEVGLTCRDGSSPYSGTNESSPLKKLDQVVGVVGPAFSKVSIQVASFLRLFKVPQISYYSTSPELSNRERFSYFKRTVPSDHFQARAVVEILRKFGWEYVSGIYEDSSYGINLFTEVERLSNEAGICFGFVEKIPFSKEDDEETDNVVSKILEKQNKNGKVVVVLFVRFSLAQKVFNSILRQKEENKIIWVGSDAWSGRKFDDRAMKDVIHGSITVQPLARKLDGFDEYFTGLSIKEDNWNPWFKEFWESHFDCTFQTDKEEGKKEPNKCDEHENIAKENGYRQLLALYFVSDAVEAFATVLKQIHTASCGDVRGVCQNMSRIITSGKHVLSRLDKVQFTDALGYNFTFLNGTDGPPRYSILTYVQRGEDYDWEEIGTFTGEEGKYELVMNSVSTTSRNYESSVCSSHCRIGQYRSIAADNKCCWTCQDCRSNQYLPSPYLCEDCPMGQLPNNFRNACYSITVERLTYSSPWTIAACSVSSVGIFLCVFVSVVYCIKRKTPVIKASGMELSLVLLAGIVLSYVSSFVFVAPPSSFICGASRFFLGTCYTLCYAAVATKTNRIYRIFDGSSPMKKKFTGWQSSLVICFLITAVEIIIVVTWLITDIPRASVIHPSVSESILVCEDTTDFSYLAVLAYPFLVMTVCLYFAVKTRKTPDGFNETSQIAFCSYSTFILWLAFIPVYFVTHNNTIRIMALCFSMSVNASVCLVSLFLTKVYTVLFKPEENTKENVMTRSSQSRHSNATDLGKTASKTASTFTLNMNGSTTRSSFQPPFTTMSTMSTFSISDIDIGLRNLRAERQISQDSGPFQPGIISESTSMSSLSRSLPNLLDHQDYRSLPRHQTQGACLQSVPEIISEQVVDACENQVNV